MREIKFRAWDEKKKVYHYACDGKGYLVTNGSWWGIYRHEDELLISSVSEAKLEQFTGLQDKNGVDIYEGDRIEFEDIGEDGYEYIEGYDFINQACVIFENSKFTLDNFREYNSGVVCELGEHDETIGVIKSSKVVGNIHEEEK